jgi:hypothetical protein
MSHNRYKLSPSKDDYNNCLKKSFHFVIDHIDLNGNELNSIDTIYEEKPVKKRRTSKPEIELFDSDEDLRFSIELTYGNDMMQEVGEDVISDTKLGEKLEQLGLEISCDSDALEVTPHCYNRFNFKDTNNYYDRVKELEIYLKKYHKLKPSSCYPEALDCEAGGHIHIDLTKVSKTLRKNSFLRNLYVFIINNPELNWLLNGPYDLFNGSMLSTNWEELLEEPEQASKEFSVIYRQSYESIEFRFFIMPRNIQEHSLHLKIAYSIYKYIYDLTKSDRILNTYYSSLDQYPTKYYDIKRNLNSCLEKIGLSDNEIQLLFYMKSRFVKARCEQDKIRKQRFLLT